MFLGASLNPDYFKKNINLFIALAPVANTSYVSSPFAKALSPYINHITQFMLLGKRYNWFDTEDKKYLTAVCGVSLFKPICQYVLNNHFFNSKVDNIERVPVFMGNEPSGQSYRTFVYYAQMMNSKRYALYDYGTKKNNKIYGADEPPLVPIEDLDIPVAIFSGSLDHIGDPEDVSFLVDKLGDKVVFHKEYNMDHYSFAIAQDMTFFEDAITVLNKYNNITDDSFLN